MISRAISACPGRAGPGRFLGLTGVERYAGALSNDEFPQTTNTTFTFAINYTELLNRYCSVFGHRIFGDCMLFDHPTTNVVILPLTDNISQTFSR